MSDAREKAGRRRPLLMADLRALNLKEGETSADILWQKSCRSMASLSWLASQSNVAEKLTGIN